MNDRFIFGNGGCSTGFLNGIACLPFCKYLWHLVTSYFGEAPYGVSLSGQHLLLNPIRSLSRTPFLAGCDNYSATFLVYQNFHRGFSFTLAEPLFPKDNGVSKTIPVDRITEPLSGFSVSICKAPFSRYISLNVSRLFWSF